MRAHRERFGTIMLVVRQLHCQRHELGTSCLCVQTGDERSV